MPQLGRGKNENERWVAKANKRGGWSETAWKWRTAVLVNARKQRRMCQRCQSIRKGSEGKSKSREKSGGYSVLKRVRVCTYSVHEKIGFHWAIK
jgi:hypothetical protein